MRVKTPFEYCLQPLLKALNWQGNDRMLFESLPHLSSIESLDKFQWVMQNLNFDSQSIALNIKRVDERLFPCLFIPEKSHFPIVLIQKNLDGILIYDSETHETKTLPALDKQGTLISFKARIGGVSKVNEQHWFRTILLKEKKLFSFIIFLTLLQTIFLLGPPVYIISLYDKVIVADSGSMLFAFFIGITIAVIALSVTMKARTRFLGYVGTHIQKHVGNAIFKQLLRLPPSYTENASVPMQIVRLNDFNVVRTFFSSSLFTTLLEFPFLLIYLFVVWLVGGVLVVIPFIAILISFVISLFTWRFLQKNIRESSMSKAEYKDFLLESFWGMRSLQYAGLQEKWISRFRDISAKSSYYGKNLLFESQVNDVVFDSIIMLSGLATLIVGAVMVINNQLQVGALVGAMFIIWRVLTPIRSINTMLPKLMQLRLSSKQINELMKLPSELPTERQWKNTPQYIVGAIGFSQVTFRYPSADSPALKNINFDLKAGQCLCVIGPSSSGKSTMANLILAIYSPQAGQIYIDNRNIKQYDVNVLRKSISYVPQKTELFYGTIAQNIALSQPLASHEQIVEAVKAAGLLKEVEALPEGLKTRIRFYSDEKLGPAFCQKINLARAYLRDAPILILDEPTGTLDDDGIQAFETFLTHLKGKKTIVLFGHNTRFLPLADFGLILYDGYIVTSGDPKTIMENLPQGIV